MTDFLSSDHLPGFVQACYIIAGVLFIAALAGLSKHETAKRGNHAGMVGMALALVATLLLAARQATLPDPTDNWRSLSVTLALIVVAMAIGAAIGAWRARTVEMTGMPELVAMLHSFVGLAAVLVGINSFLDPGDLSGPWTRSTPSRSSSASSSARSPSPARSWPTSSSARG